MSKLVEAAAEFLSRDTSTKQTRNLLESSEDPKITKKITREVKKASNHDVEDEPPIHLAKTESGHHVYHAYSEGGDSHYAVHHPNGNVTHHFIDHGNEKISEKDVDGDLHPSVKKAIVKDVNDNN